MTVRVPPNSVEAEQSVLGGLMLAPIRADEVASRLGEDDFYRKDHRMIYRAILELTGRGAPCDAVTLGEWFESNGTADLVGGFGYVVKLASDTPSASNIMAYADIVREKSVRRQIIDLATAAADAAFGSTEQGGELLDSTIAGLMGLQRIETRHEHTLRQAMSAAYRNAQAAKAAGGKIPGISSGLHQLDECLGGWHNSDLVVIGARPAMGKTALLLNFALRCDVPCGIISAEQPSDQVGARFMSMESRVNASHLRNGNFDSDDIVQLSNAVARLIDRTCLIYDRSAPSIQDVTRIARKWVQQHGIKILFVDYIQRIEAAGKHQKRFEAVGEVVRGLKNLARDLGIPVVALCQVSRAVEARQDKRPAMGDMSDSSDIEKEADQILTLYRDEVYNDDSPDKGTAEITVEKNRHGPTGFVRCAWLAETMRFENLIGGSRDAA